MDVGGWLRRLGLERYETAFREHEVSEQVLPNLTQEDLQEIGGFWPTRLLGNAIDFCPSSFCDDPTIEDAGIRAGRGAASD